MKRNYLCARETQLFIMEIGYNYVWLSRSCCLRPLFYAHIDRPSQRLISQSKKNTPDRPVFRNDFSVNACQSDWIRTDVDAAKLFAY